MPARIISAALAVLLFSIPTVLAADGVLLVQRFSAIEKGRTQVMTVRTIVTGDRIRSETRGPQDEATTTIFDGVRGRILYLDDAQKTYREVTASPGGQAASPGPDATVEMMRQAEDTMRKAEATLQKSLDRLPPEARARMEEQLKAARGWQQARAQSVSGSAHLVDSAPRLEFRQAGSDRVGRWSCDRLDGYRDGRKELELCVVSSLATLGMSDADADTVLLLPARMSGQAADVAEVAARQRQQYGYDGYAIRSISLTGDRAVSEVLEVTAQAVADSQFDVPQGYQKAGP